MNDPPLADAVRARMQQLRCEIDGDMEDMSASARTMVDWKHYVKTYPWVCLGAAVALGFLIVPKRSRAIRPDLATLTELARTGHLVVKPAPTATRRIDRCAIGYRRQHRGSQGNRPIWAKVPEDYWE